MKLSNRSDLHLSRVKELFLLLANLLIRFQYVSCCKDILQMDLHSIFIPYKRTSVILTPYLVSCNLKLAKVRSSHKKFCNCKSRVSQGGFNLYCYDRDIDDLNKSRRILFQTRCPTLVKSRSELTISEIPTNILTGLIAHYKKRWLINLSYLIPR